METLSDTAFCTSSDSARVREREMIPSSRHTSGSCLTAHLTSWAARYAVIPDRPDPAEDCWNRAVRTRAHRDSSRARVTCGSFTLFMSWRPSSTSSPHSVSLSQTPRTARFNCFSSAFPNSYGPMSVNTHPRSCAQSWATNRTGTQMSVMFSAAILSSTSWRSLLLSPSSISSRPENGFLSPSSRRENCATTEYGSSPLSSRSP